MRRRREVRTAPLLDALGGLLGRGAVGWLESADAARWVTWDGQDLRGAPTSPAVDVGAVFRARLWGPDGDLRWADGQDPRATLVRLVDDGDDRPDDVELRGTIRSTRLLWGRCVEVRDGWSLLQEERVDPLWVPAAVAPDDRAHLVVRELVATVLEGPGAGTAHVLDEVIDELRVGNPEAAPLTMEAAHG